MLPNVVLPTVESSWHSSEARVAGHGHTWLGRAIPLISDAGESLVSSKNSERRLRIS